jgi:hypothetical protein
VVADDDFFEEDSEQTAVVHLADLRGLRKPQQDRHLLVRVQADYAPPKIYVTSSGTATTSGFSS